VALAVDEKPHIQALERAQGWLKLPGGKALTGFSHEYKRHGTTTLFAALDTATGLVKAGHYRRRVEFVDFMNRLLADHPGREIHVILDNLNTTSPNPIAGWRATRTSIFTSPQPMPLGSTKSRCGSPSSRRKPWPAPLSPRRSRCAITSMLSSPRTTKTPTPSNGQNSPSSRNTRDQNTLTYAIRS
jgi:hypothetical protein